MAGERWIVLGDLNATPWSAWFPPAEVRGSLPWATFPSWYGIPIDHVLAGPDIGYDERRVGPSIGSDHRPVIAKLRVPR
jgi:endonuclease/exonuclease/phosphatase (EEP) superfamily protein YafD